MPPVASRRTGRREYNGFEINLYGFLPNHLIQKDQDASSLGFFDFWDPGNSRLEKMGGPGKLSYSIITQDDPRAGTVAVFSGPQALADDGLGKLLDSSGTPRGTVNYETGRVQVTFASVALYDVFVSYAINTLVPFATQFDESETIWDRLAEQPVIQRTFWAIELDATDIVNRIDDFEILSYVDRIADENTPLAFEGYGFEDQIVDIDLELSRAWLRSLSTMWKLKNALRMWIRLLQNLGFDIEVFPLYKKHPLNNYGENPGEIYSRVLNQITLDEQEAYEKLLEAAGFDPTAVPAPITGASVTHVIGVGSSSTVMGVQVPVITDPPDWTTITFELSSISAGIDPEVLTLNPTTGDVTGTLGAVGKINLFSGTGQIDFGRILGTEFTLKATYNVIGTPYQAARVDVEFDIDESVPFKSGDRAPNAILRAIEHVRPIHVLIRLLALNLIEKEDVVLSEGSCCGPNQAEMVEFSYPTDSRMASAGGMIGDTVFGGVLSDSPVVAGTFQIEDAGGTGQIIQDNGFKTMFGDGEGVIDYQNGLWWVKFNSPVTAIPVVTYTFFIIDISKATSEKIRYFADQADLGEARFDRSHLEMTVKYASEDIDSDFKAIAPDLVSGKNFAGTLHTDLRTNQIFIHDYATNQLITDDGAGNLVGDVDAGGTNTVNYVTGAYDVDFDVAPTDPVAVFQFDDTGAHVTNQEDVFVTLEDKARIEADFTDINVSATGRSGSKAMASDFVSGKNFVGTLQANLIPGSVVMKDNATGQTITDNGAGLLIGDVDGGGTNTIVYSTGAYDVDWLASPTDPVAVFDFDPEVIGALGSTFYSGTLNFSDPVPGTVDFKEDPGAAQTISDSTPIGGVSGAGGSGTINYLTGALDVTFNLATTGIPTAKYKFIDASGFEIENTIALGAAGATNYVVTLTGGQIVPGSVIVEDPGLIQKMQDDGITALTGNGTGTLNYLTGAFSMTFDLTTVDPVIALYDRRLAFVF